MGKVEMLQEVQWPRLAGRGPRLYPEALGSSGWHLSRGRPAQGGGSVEKGQGARVGVGSLVAGRGDHSRFESGASLSRGRRKEGKHRGPKYLRQDISFIHLQQHRGSRERFIISPRSSPWECVRGPGSGGEGGYDYLSCSKELKKSARPLPQLNRTLGHAACPWVLWPPDAEKGSPTGLGASAGRTG